MIASKDEIRPGRPNAERIAAIDKALAILSEAQDKKARSGIQECISQAEISRGTGITRARVEQLETAGKLKFLKNLATRYPESFLELGGNYAQLAFLQHLRITSTNTRRLWRKWVDIGNESNSEGELPCKASYSQIMN